MGKSYKQVKNSNAILEILRTERTNLNQKEFAQACNIPLKTYQRWISGETIGRPTLRQLKALCSTLRIEKVRDLPDDFAATNSKLEKNNE